MCVKKLCILPVANTIQSYCRTDGNIDTIIKVLFLRPVINTVYICTSVTDTDSFIRNMTQRVKNNH